MKALVTTPQGIELTETWPEPKTFSGEVRVRVHCASLNPTDLDIANGSYDGLLWLYRARSPVRTGLEFSGVVLADSQGFRKGDRVFGYTHLLKGPKLHQQIISISEDYVAKIPETLSFAQAAAAPIGLLTSFHALKQLAGLRQGDQVLINGASGGVGLYAIQVAKMLQARVTAIAGPASQAVMLSMGADAVYNYRDNPISALDRQFNAVLDLSCQLRFRQIRHLLHADAVFIPADPMKNWADFPTNPWRRQKTRYLMVDRGDHQQLATLSTRFDSGELKPVLGPEFKLEDFAQAIEALQQSGRCGRVVLDLS